MKALQKTTKVDGNVCIQEENAFEFTNTKHEFKVINIYPELEYQEIMGFGGALTESSGYVLSQMSSSKREEILNKYFGDKGLKYNMCRGHIDSCDFSLGNYSAVTDPNDTELSTFSLERDEKYILPLMRDALRISSQPISLLLSPWSPPAFMKTNGQKNSGGKLKSEYRSLWAKYICKFIKSYLALGMPVKAITIQNEPDASQPWDSCRFNAEEEADFLKNYLYPALKSNGLDDLDVLIWDHNKERAYERARDVFTKFDAEKYATGVGVHWYTGDHFDALSLIREHYPDKKLIFTEGCVEYSKGSRTPVQKAHQYAHEMIGNFSAGLNAFIDWNIVLDSIGGPNHVKNYCEAPIMCNPKDDSYIINPSFHFIGHFSKYVEPNARRIAVTRFTDWIEVVAFKNPDNSLAVVTLNKSDENIQYTLRLNDEECDLSSPAGAISTILINL